MDLENLNDDGMVDIGSVNDNGSGLMLGAHDTLCDETSSILSSLLPNSSFVSLSNSSSNSKSPHHDPPPCYVETKLPVAVTSTNRRSCQSEAVILSET